jgi:hypothetical protein
MFLGRFSYKMLSRRGDSAAQTRACRASGR